MKLALVTETYPPEINGVAMTLSRLVEGLAKDGHSVDVIRPRQKAEVIKSAAPRRREQPPKGVSEFLVPGIPIPFYTSLRIGLPVWRRLSKHWARTKPDVVHIATEGPLGFAALHAARSLGLTITSSFHTNFHAYGGHYGLRPLRGIALSYLRWFHNRTQATMVPTQEGVNQLAGEGFRQLAILARGVDVDLYSPQKRSAALREIWGVGADDPVVAYVGRLAAEKNLGLGVQAFLEIQKLAPRARFVLVGDGPERVGLARKYPEFIWAGLRRGEDLAKHYASADIFVFPSVTETFGNVITEAMASGLVVLSYDYAAAREHIRNGVNGFTAPLDNAAAFKRLAGELVTLREQWPAVQNAARETALTITWDSIIRKFEGELNQVRTQSASINAVAQRGA